MEETSNDTYAHHTRQFSDLLHIVILLSAIAPHHFNRISGPGVNYSIWLLRTYGIPSWRPHQSPAITPLPAISHNCPWKKAAIGMYLGDMRRHCAWSIGWVLSSNGIVSGVSSSIRQKTRTVPPKFHPNFGEAARYPTIPHCKFEIPLRIAFSI